MGRDWDLRGNEAEPSQEPAGAALTSPAAGQAVLPGMIARLRHHSALGLGLVAQLLQYGSGLVLLPFIVTRLPADEVGVWYIFITLQGLATLADFGFQPTFARSFSSAYAGVERIERHGHSATRPTANLRLVKGLLQLCRRFYAALAVAVVLLLVLIGFFYLPTLTQGEDVSTGNIQGAWAVLSAGIALTIYFGWNTGFLLGAGRVSAAYWGQIASRAGFILVGGSALLAGWGLVGLAAGNLAAVLAARVIQQWHMLPLLRALRRVAPDAAGNGDRKALFAALWPNASRMGLVAIGAFLITRLNVLVASSFFTLETAASYAITLQLMMAVNSVAQLPITVAVPKMVQLRVQRETRALRNIWLGRQAVLLALFATGVAFVAVAVQPLLAAVGSNVQLLPVPLTLLMGAVLLLEANHSSCALVITTGNSVPFVGSALLSGLAVAALSIASAQAGLGIAGLIASQGIVQLAYNNWKWPLELWRELHR